MTTENKGETGLQILSLTLVNCNFSRIAAVTFDHSKIERKIDISLEVKVEEELTVAFRINLAQTTGKVIKSALELLGMEVPDRM